MLFSAEVIGSPFDGVLEAQAETIPRGTRLRFQARTEPRRLVLFAVGLILSIWPGVYFMDQLMIQVLPGVRNALPTSWWYIPLTVVPLPWLVHAAIRRTRRSIHESALLLIERIAAELGVRPPRA